MNINCIYRADNWVKFSKRQSEKNEEKKKKSIPLVNWSILFFAILFAKNKFEGMGNCPLPHRLQRP
jgi:hypothetical protein